MAQRGYGAPIGREWGSDDDRDYGDYRTRDQEQRWRGGERDEDRGFFEKAGDEIRSWFQDEDDRRFERSRGYATPMSRSRNPRDFGPERSKFDRDEYSGPSRSYGMSDPSYAMRDRDFGGRQDWDRNRPTGDFSRSSGQQRQQWQSGYDRNRDIGDRNRQRDDDETTGVLIYEEFTGTLGGFGDQRMGRPEDQLYRSWRDRQMKQLDSEYQDYCREREQQFHQDFDQWRRNRRDTGGEKGELQLGSEGSGSREISGSSSPATSSMSEGSNEAQSNRSKSQSRSKS